MSTDALRPVRLVRDVRPWGGERTDLLIGTDGRIERIGAVDPTELDPAQVVDGRGLLALPGLVNAHAQLEVNQIM